MFAPDPLPSPAGGSPKPMSSSVPKRRFLTSLPLAAILLGGLVATDLQAQATQPDQVLSRNSKGTVVTKTGTVKSATLDAVIIEEDGKDKTIDGEDVVQVLFGTVPQPMVEARTYWGRGDFENAAAKFKVAAGDASATSAVKARARLRAVESFVKLGATDPSAFELARAEAETFVSEFADSRDLPRVRYLLGRSQRLAGDAAAAAETWRGLATDSTGDTKKESYDVVQGFRAGLEAADALVSAGDTTAARDLFLSYDGLLPRAIADAGDDTRTALELQRFQATARLGEGFCMLANGETSQARTFFQGQSRGNDGGPAQRFGALLGLGEVHLAEGKHREAQLAFGEVAALDHTNRDRTARALVGLAKASLELPDSTGRADAKSRIQAVLGQYADTPAVLEARSIAKTNGW